MILKHYSEVTPETTEEGPGIGIRWLIGKPEGADNFAMRLFELQPGASSPFHRHPHEHEVFVLEGQGELRSDPDRWPLKAGDFIFIPPDELHQLVNRGSDLLRFICLIPL